MAKLSPLSLKNAVAVVTGAGGGIGGALALALARRGCHLAVADLKAEPLSQTASEAERCGVHVTQHVFDIADAGAIASFPDAVRAGHGRLTVLINCAGAALGGTFEQVNLAEFEWLFQVNFWSVVRMMKAFMPLLEREPTAQIVNISSVFGLIGPPGQCAYSASKFAVRGVSEVLRHELEMSGSPIGVTCVHPGGVRTGIVRNARIAAGVPAGEAERRVGSLEKLLRTAPEEVAERIVAGIERREKRILCGADSTRVDIIQRLFPASYWDLFRRKLPKGK